MRDRIDCCRDCEDRYPGCGATCKEYKDQRAELDATKAFVKSKREADTYIRDLVNDRNDKRAKKQRKISGYHNHTYDK